MREIYLDHCATTRVDADCAAVALSIMTEDYGNPSSLHSKGLDAQKRLDVARAQIAHALDCRSEEVYFTSGGTEANNLALLGYARTQERRKGSIVCTAYEHSSVLQPLQHLAEQGFTLRLVRPLPDGNIDVQAMLDAVEEDTVLLSCMLVNSEIGTIAPLAQLARRAKRKAKNLLVHCDAVQAFGKIPVSPAKMGADLLSISSHKIHAPKGCGALYVRRGVRILPLTFGGSQEKGLRPGTENTPLACAFGYMAEKMDKTRDERYQVVQALHDYFTQRAQKISVLCMNSPSNSTPYICNLSLPGYRSEILLHFLAEKGIYVSSGSACSKGKASHVLTSMGLEPRRIDSALRVSFSAENTKQDIDDFFAALQQGLLAILPAN